jgi:hypothetical protein
MLVVIDDHNYHRTLGIGGNTAFRGLKEGMVSDVEYRNCRGWRLFPLAQLEAT